MDTVIEEYLQDRKAKRLKERVNAVMNEAEIHEATSKVEDEFNLHNWLPDAAKRAGQISLSSHPCTFSHPGGRGNKNGKTTSVIVKALAEMDGLVRSGNVHAESDALGSASALDVYKFLMLKLADGQQLFAHIENETDLAKKLLTIPTASYQELRSGFMAIKEIKEVSITSSKIKQIYFPVNSGYHQLSLLTPSGLIYALRNYVQEMRFGENTKIARELRKKNEASAHGFDDIYHLGMIGYGGTKPQNISVLNNQYGGKSYLLQCVPPTLKTELIRLPTNSFFSNCLSPSQFKTNFRSLHHWFTDPRNNVRIRTSCNEIWLTIFDEIVQEIWQLRTHEPGWSLKERFNNLPEKQKIILDDHWKNERSDDDVGLFLKDIARWIIQAYKKVLGKQAVALNDDELIHVYQLIHQQKEALL